MENQQSQQTAIAVMAEKVNNMEGSLKDMKQTVKEILNKLDHTYATKEELAVVDKKAQESKDAIRWFAMIVVGAVILAILGLVLTNQT